MKLHAKPLALLFGALLTSVCALTALPTSAQTIRVANQGDALSLDPQTLQETLQLSLLGNVYEGLVGRDKQMNPVPALATAWQQISPTVWRFTLRQGVRFHDGKPLTADDVVFSFNRAKSPSSAMRALSSDVKEVRKIDATTVDIETHTVVPIFPRIIPTLYIMSRAWCEENQALEPADRRKNEENAASFKANGTGPYRVTERQPDVRTVFVRNDDYWGEIESNAREFIFTPIANDATRVAALLSGAVDVVEPVPLQDVARINVNVNTKVLEGPELRTIFLGMDQYRDELLYSSVKGKNPFKDKRVRQAFYQAIDIEGIKKTIMRGAATPVAQMVGVGINGFQPDMQRLPFDVAAAKKLLTEAGYGDGFTLTMNCPNDRYVNDSRICQAVAANLSRIGVKINLQAEAKATYFPKINNRDTSFYMLGWTPTTYDAHNTLNAIMACVDDKGAGQYNLGRYCNGQVDALTQKIQSETDETARDAMIRQAFAIHADDIGHLPLHQQALAWGVSKNITLTQLPSNYMPFKWISIQP